MPKAIHWDDLEIQERLGAGQAGEVWRARLLSSRAGISRDTLLAIKQYKGWVLEQPGTYERIIRELEIGRRLRHPNLVETITMLRMPDGRPALVMKFYEGETLDIYIQRHRDSGTTAPIEEALSIVGQLAGAISTLHENGTIHRDVKPANIQLTEDGPVLMDFGVVRNEDFPEQTTAMEFLGTIRYADPDYLFHGKVSNNIDLYGLAGIAYELFTGNSFISNKTHWASLVAEKFNHSPKALHYKEVQDIYLRSNPLEADFARYICKGLLRKEISLPHLESAVNAKTWTNPFRYGKEGFESENGTSVFPEFGEAQNCTEHIAREVSIEYVANHIKQSLTKEEYGILMTMLSENYGNVDGFVIRPQSLGRRLSTCPRHALVMGLNDEIHYDNWVFWFPKAVRIAYRNGLL